MPDLCLSLVLLGGTGTGKSSTGNTLLGRQAFILRKSPASVPQDVVAAFGEVCGIPIAVYDTPGLSGTERKEELHKHQEVLQKCESGPCVYLLVLQLDRFTEEERKRVEKIEELLGEKRLQNAWILFTGGDKLEEENKRINEFINDTEALKKLIQKYEGRYHLFNNKCTEKQNQMKDLTYKLYQRKMENVLKRRQQRILTYKQDFSTFSPSSRRIVLLGKTGFGKSAVGNTILGQNVFISKRRMNSVTRECSAAQATVSGRSVSVVDTPGFFDTQMKHEELMVEIARSVWLSSPGPHAFLIVFPVTMRFTEQELQIAQQIEQVFGEEVLKYSIILFTHGDQLDGESIEELIKENSALSQLLDQCGGRYQLLNNRDVNNREQVEDLLQKIDSMVQQNGGGHYSNEMFEEAQRFRQEEEEERQREEEERQREEEERKLQEEKQIQEEIERVIKETEERVRAEYKEKKKQEEKQKQEEIERVRKETGERVRAEYKEKKKQEQEEIERVRAENEAERRKSATGSKFKEFYRKHRCYFFWAAVGAAVGFVVGGFVGGAVGAVGGAVVGAGVGFAVGAAVRKNKGGVHSDDGTCTQTD